MVNGLREWLVQGTFMDGLMKLWWLKESEGPARACRLDRCQHQETAQVMCLMCFQAGLEAFQVWRLWKGQQLLEQAAGSCTTV